MDREGPRDCWSQSSVSTYATQITRLVFIRPSPEGIGLLPTAGGNTAATLCCSDGAKCHRVNVGGVLKCKVILLDFFLSLYYYNATDSDLEIFIMACMM